MPLLHLLCHPDGQWVKAAPFSVVYINEQVNNTPYAIIFLRAFLPFCAFRLTEPLRTMAGRKALQRYQPGSSLTYALNSDCIHPRSSLRAAQSVGENYLHFLSLIFMDKPRIPLY